MTTTNVDALFHAIGHSVPHLEAVGGSIVDVSSVSGPDASFVTGVNLPVDGGVSASNVQPNLG